MNRAGQVRLLAPMAPPCFADRQRWLEYLEDAAVYQREHSVGGPLVIEKGKPARFNYAWSFCFDCHMAFATRMRQEGRCRPQFVAQQQEKAVVA